MVVILKVSVELKAGIYPNLSLLTLNETVVSLEQYEVTLSQIVIIILERQSGVRSGKYCTVFCINEEEFVKETIYKEYDGPVYAKFVVFVIWPS